MTWFSRNSANAQFPLGGKRKPMYAGSWYDDNPERLKAQLAEFLARAEPLVDDRSAAILTRDNPPIRKPVLAIVVPHAGYVFSGQAAAHAYKACAEQKVKRIFLLGPSHHVGMHGAALPMAITFATPLGDLEVDKQVIAELKEYPIFSKRPDVHKVEHSLEMQLPYIREVFGDVKLVPIVIGQLRDAADIRLVAEILKGYIEEDDLVVVSSDFTHFGPRYGYRPFHTDIKDNIHKLDARALSYLMSLNLDGFLKFQEETKDTICGFYPCAVLAAMLPEQASATVLRYYTSQDTDHEDKDNSVSYIALGFSGLSWPDNASRRPQDLIALSATDKEGLLKLARGTLDIYVREKKIPTPEELGVKVSKPMQQVLGVFVTLHKEGSPGATAGKEKEGPRELRGCIGHIWPVKPLYQAVIDNAVSACSKDYRFNSVKPEELDYIRVEISVLTPPRRISSYEEIEIGRDGIVLFKDSKQAVFLPHVAPEFGWDLPKTLTQLSLKAGLLPDDWKKDAKFDVFQANVFEEPERSRL